MTDPEALQLILGPDKRNPCFCLYVDAEEKEIHVYYGLEVLEVVPNDPRSPAYRLLGARLYNAGLRVRTLEATMRSSPGRGWPSQPKAEVPLM